MKKKMNSKNSKKKYIKSILKGMMIFCVLFIMGTITVYADGTTVDATAVTGPINLLKDLFAGIVTGIGAIILIYGIFELANGWNGHDSSQVTAGLKKVVSGLIMAVAPQLAIWLLG